MRRDRIYPVPIKPASNISNWGKWPADVEPIIRGWNKGKGLSFVWGGVFKCTDCELFCESHSYGAAEFRGDLLCDDCLIERARTVEWAEAVLPAYNEALELVEWARAQNFADDHAERMRREAWRR